MSKTTTATSTITARVLASDQADYMSAGQVRVHFGGVSAMWLVRKIQDHHFPKPTTFGTSRRYWRVADVVAWEQQRAKTQ
jgi:predicted DNA-binding transcriptional regulator AlpA